MNPFQNEGGKRQGFGPDSTLERRFRVGDSAKQHCREINNSVWGAVLETGKGAAHKSVFGMPFRTPNKKNCIWARTAWTTTPLLNVHVKALAFNPYQRREKMIYEPFSFLGHNYYNNRTFITGDVEFWIKGRNKVFVIWNELHRLQLTFRKSIRFQL